MLSIFLVVYIAFTTKCAQSGAEAPAIGITVKAGSLVAESGGEEYLKINLVGTCHEATAPGVVDRRRSILDGREGTLAGLQESSLPRVAGSSGHGTHADSTLLYVVSTEPGVQRALLSKVPMQQLQRRIPKECLDASRLHLNLPLDPQHRAWPGLYKIFQPVECELCCP